MGMDAKARIFYGYKEPICDYVDEDGELLPEYQDEKYRVVYGNGYDNQYLAIADSYMYFDWDYGVQNINPTEMHYKEEIKKYYDQIKEFFKDKAGFSSDKVGWFVICDFS